MRGSQDSGFSDLLQILPSTASLNPLCTLTIQKEQMMADNKKSVLVTGGNGFIASHILAQLLEVYF